MADRTSSISTLLCERFLDVVLVFSGCLLLTSLDGIPPSVVSECIEKNKNKK